LKFISYTKWLSLITETYLEGLDAHRGEPLREDVDELRYRRDMEDTYLIDGNLISDKMKINLHMFKALMLNGVGEEVHDADVVTVDKGELRWWGLELVEQLSQSSGLSHAVGNGTILGLSAGVGDDGLPLDLPENQVVP
jgi:hypothetical protein